MMAHGPAPRSWRRGSQRDHERESRAVHHPRGVRETPRPPRLDGGVVQPHHREGGSPLPDAAGRTGGEEGTVSKQRDVALAEVRAGIAELEDALQVLSEFDDEMYER